METDAVLLLYFGNAASLLICANIQFWELMSVEFLSFAFDCFYHAAILFTNALVQTSFSCCLAWQWVQCPCRRIEGDKYFRTDG